MYVCIYICIYTYIYIKVHIYIYDLHVHALGVAAERVDEPALLVGGREPGAALDLALVRLHHDALRLNDLLEGRGLQDLDVVVGSASTAAVCVYMCVYVCVYIYIHMFTYIYIYMNICICVYIYV